MTFAPTKKMSKKRSHVRTTNWIKITARKLAKRVSLQYENGEAVGLSHFATTSGTYKWRKVYNVKTKQKKVTRI